MPAAAGDGEPVAAQRPRAAAVRPADRALTATH